MIGSSDQFGPLAALLSGAGLSVIVLLVFAFVQHA